MLKMLCDDDAWLNNIESRTSCRPSLVLQICLIISCMRSAHCASDKSFWIFEAFRLKITRQAHV